MLFAFAIFVAGAARLRLAAPQILAQRLGKPLVALLVGFAHRA